MAGKALHQYLTFMLGDELFAMDIGFVREIIDDKNITKIPRTPDYMRGVINLRGHAVPIVDLRLKFGMSITELDVDTCAIITDIELEDGVSQIGALADSVQEVMEINPDDMSAPPRMGTSIDVSYIRGIAKKDEKFILVLDLERFFSDVELPAEVKSLEPQDVQGEVAAAV